ncbi:tripartite tricarboxylate transporter TctB family protein [Shimia aestuarii]|uniref:Tripartite tricarboxylate transporter TctB family protein n=1 Tax=Shimia aestuarii TaxID=254406 RepID=A0A1I4JIB5_9RHOB|nr:tripartite tricarboxylate transporter TctB family protein [Shimia aestuarii]SFL65933.1 Tripartite tricarboxylate transporter TctB family protein [Shimia aestuarii]
MSSLEEKRFPGPLRGQLIFAIVFFVVALLLLSQIGEQTKWVKRTKFFAQPRFWPAVGLIGMVVFGGLHLWKLPRRRFDRMDYREWRIWFLAIEWVGWFLLYVLLVPIIGYLPTTMIFMPIITWRLGYRDKRMLWVAATFGTLVVVLFKSLLQVKIPGGLIYEYLPSALRSFFILNL